MASLADIHVALAERLLTIEGLQVFDHPTSGITPPTAFVELAGGQVDSMSRNSLITYQFRLMVFTAEAARPQDGYQSMLPLIDHMAAGSVGLAIWDGNDRAAGTFGGLANTHASIAGFEALGAEQVDAFNAHGVEFACTVLTTP